MKKNKRVTIYDLANELGISASYVSRALNNHPGISEKMKQMVQLKAQALNYRHNTNAANLRKGASSTIGVIVPKINENFFSNAIAGIEEACTEHQHHLIICQSDESYEKEVAAVQKLINLNVDCIIISVSAETSRFKHLEEIMHNNIQLVQFDRTAEVINSCKVENDTRDAARQAVLHLLAKGYKRIAYIGGPEQLPTFRDRKEGFLSAMEAADIVVPWNYIVGNVLTKEKGIAVAMDLLQLKNPPDAIVTVTDYVALGVLQAAGQLGITVPDQLGVFGFANEIFAELISPGLSSVEQHAKVMGRRAADCYFEGKEAGTEVIKCEVLVRRTTK
ncbi:LacI family transcriptional regulator [Chitinophaga filiformis]|uniref:LacI family DNA-binding transcriptional regulator n=1 Tax=Chitinophaga filiformis TaxID=104663 RepID=UPI001F424232|nr:LacI family DNA-binding transcriptional regulator [Chitinophaga filiformis]MCF6403783.1 LacI family transcriptional regulator [Chitinophaga filiformis]